MAFPRIGYIYKTTNLINGKVYIGQHQRDELDTKYYGSGIKIRNALRKYGKAQFRIEVLCWENSIERLNTSEIAFVVAYDSCNPSRGYNLSFGGAAFNKGRKASAETRTKLRAVSTLRAPMSEETRRKLCIAQRKVVHTAEWHAKIGLAHRGKMLSEETKEKDRVAHRGKKHTEATKLKLSLANMGKNSGRKHTLEENEKNRMAHLGKPAWNKGIPASPEGEERLRKMRLGTKLSDEHKRKLSLGSQERWARWRRSKLGIAV